MIPIWIVTIILFVIGVIAQAWDLSTHEPVD
jgi:hypothetical protein